MRLSRKTHRLMYNMTNLSHQVTLTYLDLRSNLTFQCHIIYGSTRLDETNTMLPKSLLYLLNYRCYCRKTIFVKIDHLIYVDLNFDLS